MLGEWRIKSGPREHYLQVARLYLFDIQYVATHYSSCRITYVDIA
jgi:hypothetical protein